MPNDRNEPAAEPTGDEKGPPADLRKASGRFEGEDRRSEASQRHAPRLGAVESQTGRRSPPTVVATKRGTSSRAVAFPVETARGGSRPCLSRSPQQIVADALRGGFEVVGAEALDRISRDHVAAVFKRMAFAGVKIITLAGARNAALRGLELLAKIGGHIVEKRDVRVVTSWDDLSDDELRALAGPEPPGDDSAKGQS